MEMTQRCFMDKHGITVDQNLVFLFFFFLSVQNVAQLYDRTWSTSFGSKYWTQFLKTHMIV